MLFIVTIGVLMAGILAIPGGSQANQTVTSTSTYSPSPCLCNCPTFWNWYPPSPCSNNVVACVKRIKQSATQIRGNGECEIVVDPNYDLCTSVSLPPMYECVYVEKMSLDFTCASNDDCEANYFCPVVPNSARFETTPNSYECMWCMVA